MLFFLWQHQIITRFLNRSEPILRRPCCPLKDEGRFHLFLPPRQPLRILILIPIIILIISSMLPAHPSLALPRPATYPSLLPSNPARSLLMLLPPWPGMTASNQRYDIYLFLACSTEIFMLEHKKTAKSNETQLKQLKSVIEISKESGLTWLSCWIQYFSENNHWFMQHPVSVNQLA